ncbi:primosomal protein N' [Pseudarthrobacter sp. J75]|uniref:primosomal protein N' n=1 Tax=unclassified Pseudarthrobacter TaxID=2647000 RepID=UPI002E80EFE3|nr:MULTISPECIES: primosomal protein N' [unclassified Pseudarthrobacter]MEE2523358.1 primosomal protein N' [Pseudarthrobacter sp. J47]MEE2529323.1 primosomal protein N' [Pseudarthrobacter sp. J75]
MASTTPGQGDGVQLSLLQGFPASAAATSGIALAAVNPVARVLVESGVPHLDRPFDYSVPASLDDTAVPGVRVKVTFNGQELSGYLLERQTTSDAGHTLVPLRKVVSAVPVLTPAVRRLAESVAARYAGTVSDVLRVAVPPRVAKLDKEYLARHSAGAGADAEAPATSAPATGDMPSVWAGYRSGSPFLLHLAGGGSPRAAVTALQGYGDAAWPALLAEAIVAVRASGRGAVVVVPDYRDLDRLEKALAGVLPAGDVVRLSADDGPGARYGNFLRLLEGSARVAIGTRSAAYAPVLRPGLFACWDDGDDLHIEQRAPYAHTREVLLLRSEQEEAACLLAGHARSTEAQRLVEQGWAVAVEPDRPATRLATPRVVNTADSFEQERDPLARIARLPGAAWKAAQDGLLRGPVLVQVARAGYAPSLVCDTCREPARCNSCQGPLAVAGSAGSASVPQCRWCSTPAPRWQCGHCGGQRLRRGATGVIRTAEELGKAFPGRPVITSSGDHVKASVGDSKALVVATVGAEPVATGGYAAALLLDGDSLLRRENLRAGEDTLRRWFNAAALVRPAKEGGLVVVTAGDTAAVGALLRWDPSGYAGRELALRRELQLPPAVRIASITGQSADVAYFTDAVQRQLAAADIKLRTAGPAPVVLGRPPVPQAGSAEADVRTLLFIPYAEAAEVTRILRATRASSAAKRTAGPVQLRLDGTDVL